MRSLLKTHFFVSVFLVFLANCRLGDLNKRRGYAKNQTDDKIQDRDEPVLVGVPILYEQRKYVAKEFGIDPHLIMGNMQEMVYQDHYPEPSTNSLQFILGGTSLKREKRGIIWNKIQQVKKGIQRVQKGIVSVRNRITKLLKGSTTGNGSESTERPKYPTTAGDGGPKWKPGSSSSSGSTGGGYSSTGSSGGSGWGQSGNSGGYSGSSTSNNGGYGGSSNGDNQGGYSTIRSSQGGYAINDNHGGYSSHSDQGGYSTSGRGYQEVGYADNKQDSFKNGYVDKPGGYSTSGPSQSGYGNHKPGNGSITQGGYARKMQQANFAGQVYMSTSSSNSEINNKNSRSASSSTFSLARGEEKLHNDGGASAVGHSSSTSTSKYPSYPSSYTRSSTKSTKAPVSAVRSARELEMIAQRFDKNIKTLNL